MTITKNSADKFSRFRMTLDGSGCEQHSLIECMQFIMEVVNTLKISLRSQTAYEFDDLVPGTLPGIIITVISPESSLSLHAWTSDREVSLDIFSSKSFPRKVIEKAFKYFFKPKDLVVGGD